MKKSDAQLIAELRKHSAEMELKAVDFLDARGNHPLQRNKYTAVRLTYIDGKVITLPRRLEKHFDQQIFKLRPIRNDA